MQPGKTTTSDHVGSDEPSSYPRSSGNLCAGGEPVVVSSEFDPEPVIIDPEITIGPRHDGPGHHGLDLLRDDPDIRLVAAEIAEAVIT